MTRESDIRELDVDRLIGRALDVAGLSSFGPFPCREPLAQLLECAVQEIRFNDAGVKILRDDIVRCLVNRLRIQRDIENHPEILDQDVSDPIVVIGLGRSGTTKLHKMLSAANDVQKTYFWRLWNPGRLSNDGVAEPDARIALAGQSQLIDGKPIPDAIHHYGAMEVEEDGLLHMLSFEDIVWSYMTLFPCYFDRVTQTPNKLSYDYTKLVLQYLQWQDGGKRDRPWILKSIMHIANIDVLMQVYPRATVVFPHRDPADTIPSLAKWQASSWAIQGEPTDLHFVGRETLRMRSIATERCLAARDRGEFNERILDVPYEAIRSDPMPVIEKIYEAARRSLPGREYDRMRAWHDSNEQNRFGSNDYSLAEFGLTDSDIDRSFDAYIHRYIER
jgi:hypothetical protein